MSESPTPTVNAQSAERTPYGLIGRKLGHSWSPQVHAQLGSTPFSLIELEPDEVEPFIHGGTWKGLNVTIPYKRQAAELADERSWSVELLGVSNTLVRREDGTIYADNTDVLGFSWMLDRFCRREYGRRASDLIGGLDVLVLGSGGASQAVQASVEREGARPVVISRKGPDNYESILERHGNAVMVINATPVGMYPNCPASPMTDEMLANLPGLLGVLDVVYNPLRTGICLAADRLGVPSESGIAMLVSQARYSSELFQGKHLDDDIVLNIERDLITSTENVIFIGMPGAGKTSCGKRLARLLGRPFVDIDDAIEAECGRRASDIIEQDGEDAFRAIETEVTGSYCARSGLVIACGGGVVTRPENYDLLHQNGRIVMVDRPLDQLSDKGRPVSKSKGIERIAEERMDLYRSWADVVLHCTGSAASDAVKTRTLLGL